MDRCIRTVCELGSTRRSTHFTLPHAKMLSGEVWTAIAILILIESNASIARSSVSQTIQIVTIQNHNPPPPCAIKDSIAIRKCGVKPNVNTADLQSNVAGFGEFPWQVAIVDAHEHRFMCSGSLIGSRMVLTSTTCVGNMMVTDIRVRVGEWDILSEKQVIEPFGSEDIPVVKKYLYTDGSMKKDVLGIALLKLKRSVQYDLFPHVSPVCLPNEAENLTALTNCYVAGWGDSPIQFSKDEELQNVFEDSITVVESCDMNGECHLETSKKDFNIDNNPEGTEWGKREEVDAVTQTDELQSRVLHKAAVKIESYEECFPKVSGTINLKSTQLCVFPQEGAELCQVDAGSPVVCQMREDQTANRTLHMLHNLKYSKFFNKILKKEMKEMHFNTIPQHVIIGIVGETPACSKDKAVPLLAINVPKMIRVICRLASM